MTFADAINDTLLWAMNKDPKTLFFGLGATDPKRLFGTAKGLLENFGPDRVFDMPTSENGMTGIAIGAAIQGYRPIMTHQRLDFFLLAMDQLVNNAAKWHYMFGGQDSVPLTIRLILGRGWGQGPTHSQSLHSWFAHVPGLKVVMPSTSADASGLLASSIFDNNPVIFLEHRWLHHQLGAVPEKCEPIPLGKGRLLSEGQDYTIVSCSYMTVEAVRAVKLLADHGIHCDLIDLRTIQPLDWDLIDRSVRKTGRLLVLDIGASSFGISSEIISSVCTRLFSSLKQAPQKLAAPDYPIPTSVALSEQFYNGAEEIAGIILSGIKKQGISLRPLQESHLSHDVPGEWFRGPF